MIPTTKRALAQLCTSGMVLHLTLLIVPGWFSLVFAFDKDTFVGIPAYSAMESVMSQANWSLFSASMFIIALCLWIHNTTVSNVASLCTLCFWHGMISTCALLSGTVSPGSGTYAILALAATLRMFGLVYEHTR